MSESAFASQNAYDFLHRLLHPYHCDTYSLSGRGCVEALRGLGMSGEANPDGTLPTRAPGGAWHPADGVLEAVSADGEVLRAGVTFNDSMAGELGFHLHAYLHMPGDFLEDEDRVIAVWTQVVLTPLGDVFVGGPVDRTYLGTPDLRRFRNSMADGLAVLRAWSEIRERVRPWRGPSGASEHSCRF